MHLSEGNVKAYPMWLDDVLLPPGEVEGLTAPPSGPGAGTGADLPITSASVLVSLGLDLSLCSRSYAYP